MKSAILILDDDQDVRNLFQAAFRGEGIQADTAASVEEAKSLLKERTYDGALTDIYLENENGLQAVSDLIRISPLTRFFFFTGHESVPLAVDSMELGAAGFFPKSLGPRKIVDLLKSKLSVDETDEEIDNFDFESFNLVGRSKVMKRIFSQIKQFSSVDSTVLITGESGTGKEVVAKALHRLSVRRQGPFEAINCGAIPETLLESELFGHRKGAFTDAKSDKKGLFEACSNGTLMLDEIGDMPLSLQVKILRVLQEREVRPLGATRSLKVNPRIIACTHRDLNQLVREGKFRKDLFFRLSVLQINIPPLRERLEDIPPLVNVFLERFNQRFKRSVAPISQELITRLKNYDWPGNIRELQNALERAVVLSNDGVLHYTDLFPQEEPGSEQNGEVRMHAGSPIPLSHERAKKNFEKSYIENLLTEAHGNISEAARLSGKHRVEIYRLMDKYNLRRDDFLDKTS